MLHLFICDIIHQYSQTEIQIEKTKSKLHTTYLDRFDPWSSLQLSLSPLKKLILDLLLTKFLMFSWALLFLRFLLSSHLIYFLHLFFLFFYFFHSPDKNKLINLLTATTTEKSIREH